MNIKTLTRPIRAKVKTVKKAKRPNSCAIEYSSFYLVFTCIVKPSANDKTGQMIQSYLISKERLEEKSVFGAKCETCPISKQCYVNEDKLSVRGALKRLINGENTSYVWSTLDEVLPLLKGRSVRFGTYGDPSIIPLDDLCKLIESVGTWTGYTHYWREIDPSYSTFFMASVENLEDEIFSKSLGYRPFRVVLNADSSPQVTEDSIECPHYTKGIQCVACGLCKGSASKAKSIYVYQH